MENATIVIQLVIGFIAVLSVASITLFVSQRLRVPFAVCLVCVGFGVAQLANYGPEIFRPIAQVKISQDLIFFVLLPTLVFESAYDLDTWQLRHNLFPILTLALPGVVLSTALIGFLVGWLTTIDFLTAFLLGAVLSAIDHVSVSSMFKHLGAPKRLIILVEGESLFSDVTLIVMAYILLDVVLAGSINSDLAITGVVHFIQVLLGGITIGLICGFITGHIVGNVNDNSFIEVSAVLVMAYLSFLIAEYGFHVSGVMATAVAGLMMSGWGKTKISPSVRQYLEDIWKYLSFISMAIIFLLVGFLTDLTLLFDVLDILVWVIVAVLIARAVVVFGLLPIIGKMPRSEPVDWRYQAAMYWGGIRGAVALALTMSLGEFEYSEEFRALVTGVVFFTLLVPGLSLRWLIQFLGLDKPSLAERFSLVEGSLSAKQHALECGPGLRAGGLFSPRIAEDIEKRYQNGIDQNQQQLEKLRKEELDNNKEFDLVLFRCLSEEKTFYFDMFTRGHVSEQAFRQLTYSVDLQIDSLRYKGLLPNYTNHPKGGKRWARLWHKLFNLAIISLLTEKIRSSGTAREYEQVWARQQATLHILNNLEQLEYFSDRREILDEVKNLYTKWNESARKRIDEVAEQFPEFVNAMQHRLAERLFLHTERDSIMEKIQKGTLTESVAEKILEAIDEEIRNLRGRATGKLKIDISELLKKVPFFKDISSDDFKQISKYLRSVIYPAGIAICEQGEHGDSLYLVARGVIRVSINVDDRELDVATMIAGDFFGEIALLNDTPRTATCRAVTPCVLYELRRKDFNAIRISCPTIEQTLQEADSQRHEELKNIGA